MIVNFKSINNTIKKNYNTTIKNVFMEVAEINEECTTVLIALTLDNEKPKMIEYQYDNDNPDSYGYNVEEFDPTCFKMFSQFFTP